MGLNVLGACQNPQRKYGLPSWVPNLIDDWKAYPFINVPIIKVTKSKPSTDFDGDTLVVKGFHYDSIAVLCEDVILDIGASVAQLHDMYQRWQRFVSDGVEKEQVDEARRATRELCQE